MGHNVSNDTRRRNILQWPLGSLSEWTLLVGCPRCRRRTRLPVRQLLERHAPEHQLIRVVNRLRCSTPACGLPPSTVVIESALHSVVLVGPGAFT